MSALLIYDPRPVYFNGSGAIAAGGSLKFFAAGTTTPQDVYGDQDLSTNNGSVLTLGSDGRTSVDVWGDASLSYRIQLFDVDGNKWFDVDNVGLPGGTGNQIPSLSTGQFLTNDGSQLLWAPINQLPDPTGQSGKVLSTDGTSFTWIAKPADGAAGTNADITVTSSSFKASPGTGSHWLVQMGTGSAPASGTPSTGVTVEFDTEFSTTPKVFITPTTNATSGGYLAIPETNSVVTTGFSVQFSTNSTDSEANFINPLTFNWIAFGTLA